VYVFTFEEKLAEHQRQLRRSLAENRWDQKTVLRLLLQSLFALLTEKKGGRWMGYLRMALGTCDYFFHPCVCERDRVLVEKNHV